MLAVKSAGLGAVGSLELPDLVWSDGAAVTTGKLTTIIISTLVRVRDTLTMVESVTIAYGK